MSRFGESNEDRVLILIDDGVLDANEKDGNTSAPHDDGDNDFDGDYPVKDGATWNWSQDLSPHDIDNDGLVELPRKAQVPVSTDEYTKAQVVRHTVTHEMGHATGISGPYPGGHCNESTCLMYQYSNNWNRDGHFCDDCRGMIRVHNNQ